MRLDIRGSEKDKDRAQVKGDALLNTLKSITPEQAAQWVDSNVNSLADAKNLLKTMARVITYLVRRGI